jgi:threonine/homoserine/homoserine lactone efflux protein
VAGVHVGTLVHVLAAAVGLSALIVASSVAFSVVKYAGAAYLVFLGIRRLLERTPALEVDRSRVPVRRAFLRGALVNVLNPKTALFFLAFLPQFVDPDRIVWTQVVVFGLTFVVLGLLSDSLCALVAGSLAAWLRRRRQILRYASGSVFVGLGVSAAFAKRA